MIQMTILVFSFNTIATPSQPSTISENDEAEIDYNYLTQEGEIISFSIERQNAREAKLKQTISQLRAEMSRNPFASNRVVSKITTPYKMYMDRYSFA